jgi:MIP family channel proteins
MAVAHAWRRVNLRKQSLIRRIGAEAFGTFVLTFTAVAMAAASNPELDHYSKQSTAVGLVVLALIYTLSDLSGAHINPAVSLAFALRRAFPWWHLVVYCLAQLGGAMAGATVAVAITGQSPSLGLTVCHSSAVRGLVAEILATFFLVSVTLHTSKRRATVGPQAAIAVGATIVACTLWAGPLTGTSLNPARSLGPAILSGDFNHAWIYVAGPALGAAGRLRWLSCCVARRPMPRRRAPKATDSLGSQERNRALTPKGTAVSNARIRQWGQMA